MEQAIMGLTEPGALTALVQVILIDLVFAADNAIAIGLVASQVPVELRRRVIMLGIAAAAVMRIVFALITVELLSIPGILLVAGLMLVWITIKLGRDTWKETSTALDKQERVGKDPIRNIWKAGWAILIADLSMSLDNVVAVASAAREHALVLVIGLTFAVVAMGTGAHIVARMLDRWKWIAWVGIGIIAWVSINMVIDGGKEVVEMMKV